MKQLIGAVLAACACIALVFAQPRKALSEDSSVAETLKQLSQDFGNAIRAADISKLNQILDEDWTEITQRATILTKKKALSDLASGQYKLKSFENGPMYVKDLGNVAVVQGSVNETSISNGKENSRKSVWMDVWLKRGDRWVVVRSLSATAK